MKTYRELTLEAKATYCGRCGTTHVPPSKGGTCPALKKEASGDLSDACWKGYKAIGMKKKGGKMVPNCVPEEVELQESKMAQLHTDIENVIGKHVKAYNAGHLGDDQFGEKVIAAHKKISKLHGIAPEHAKKFVNDYVDQNMKEEVDPMEDENELIEAHTTPKTKKEKDLASLAHPKGKITHKDILVGRGVIKKEEWSNNKNRAVSEGKDMEDDKDDETPFEGPYTKTPKKQEGQKSDPGQSRVRHLARQAIDKMIVKNRMKKEGIEVEEDEVVNEDMTKMDTPALKKWIATRQRNAMGGNLTRQRGDEYDQAQAELKKRKSEGMKEEVEELDEGNKENKAKKNEYVANIIKQKLHPSVLPSLKYGRRELKKEELEAMLEEMGTPDIKVRKTYTDEYAKSYNRTLRLNPKGASARAQAMAYDAVQSKHGAEARNALKAFHDKNQSEEVEQIDELSPMTYAKAGMAAAGDIEKRKKEREELKKQGLEHDSEVDKALDAKRQQSIARTGRLMAREESDPMEEYLKAIEDDTDFTNSK